MPWDAVTDAAKSVFGIGDEGQDEKQSFAGAPCTTTQALAELKDSLRVGIMKSCYRMDIDFPPGIRLGLTTGFMDSLSVPRGPLTKERIAQADQELAQLVAGLLLSIEKLRFAFRTGSLAKAAKQAFNKDSLKCTVMAISRSGKRGAFRGADEHSAFRRAILDSPEGVLVVVAPRTKQLRVIDQISKEVGPKRCIIILLNARLRGLDEKDSLRDSLRLEYRPAFNLRLVGQHGQEGIVYRHIVEGGDLSPWILARKQLELSPDGKSEDLVGKELYSSDLEPSPSKIAATFGLET